MSRHFRNTDHSLNRVGQFYKNPPLYHTGNHTFVAFSQMRTHVFRLVAILTAAFHRHGSLLRRTGMHCRILHKSSKAALHFLRSRPLERFAHNPMNCQIRIAADWRGKMRIFLKHQAKVSLIHLGIPGLGHGTQKLTVHQHLHIGPFYRF